MREPTNTLSLTLRQLRKEAGLSGTEAAKKAGLSQSKVSRSEVGSYMPTPDQVSALCKVYRASSEQRKELVNMAKELAEDRVSSRVVFERGGWMMQERIGRIEQLAGYIRSVSPSGVIPGLLQTRDYCRALFGDSMSREDRDRTVEARIARQELLDSERKFTFVLTEGPLRFNIGGAYVMSSLLRNLIDVSTRENVDLGLIPFSQPVTVPLLHPFDIYDRRAVLVGTQTATALMTESTDVSGYESHWFELKPFVSWEDDARAVVERIASEYQQLT